MSRSLNGKFLHCDAPTCQACVVAPIVLTERKRELALPDAAGRWLFVVHNGVARHFCPEHTEFALTRKPEVIQDALRFHRIALVLDSTSAKSRVLEQACAFLRVQRGACVTVHYAACGRCAPVGKSGATLPIVGSDDETYCPGTRRTLETITCALTSLPVSPTIRVHGGGDVMRLVIEAACQGIHDLIIAGFSGEEEVLPSLPIPILALTTSPAP